MSRLTALALAMVACVRPGNDRAERDLTVGRAEGSGLSVTIEEQQGQVVSLAENRLDVWAQGPVLRIAVRADANPTPPYRVRVANCMPYSRIMRVDDDGSETPLPRDPSARTACSFRVPGVAPNDEFTLSVAPLDSGSSDRLTFAVLGDFQTALDRADQVFAAINADPEIRFVLSTGDLVESASEEEYDLLHVQLTTLDVPLYSTIGNHELAADDERWTERFGPMNLHFTFHQVAFSFLDSGSASIDPLNHDRLARWLDAGRDGVHVFGTHYPPLDPVGSRNASFRSRAEAAKLLSRLAQGGVDATFYGHIHSFYAFENAGMPAYVSGGGGAIPERGDGVGRHFLRVVVDPSSGLESVRLVPVP